MVPSTPGLLVLLPVLVVAFLGGVGIATVGPGGIFVTIALVVFTATSPGTIAGTMSAVLLAGGLAGTAAYWRSGELATREGRHLAVTLSVASAVGAFAGSQLNAVLSAASFEPLLAAFVLLIGVLLAVRERRQFEPVVRIDPGETQGSLVVAGIGIAVGLPSGLFGVGGPVLAVPLLVLAGVPLLGAVASAQLLSVFVTGAATAGYLVRGTVDPTLLGLIVLPLLAGIGVGWRIAHRVDGARLRRVLSVVLLLVGGYPLLRSIEAFPA